MAEPSSKPGSPRVEGTPAAPLPGKEKGGQLPLEESGEHVLQVLKEGAALPQRREADIIKGLSEETLTQGAEPVQEEHTQRHIALKSAQTSSDLHVEEVRESVIPLSQRQVPLSSLGMLGMVGASSVPHPTNQVSWEVANPKPKSELQLKVEEGLVPEITIPGVAQGHTIPERMKELGIRGVSVAVINDGKVVWSQGYGELEHPRQLSQTASLGKVVTSLTVLSLIDQCRQAEAVGKPSPLAGGKMIGLDTDAGDILDKSLWDQINPAHHKVTIRQLLSHTAGIPEGGRGYACVEAIDQQFLEEVQLVARGMVPPVPGFDSAVQDLAVLQKECTKATPDAVHGIDQRILQKQQEILSLVGTNLTTLSPNLQMARKRLLAMHNLRKEEAVPRMSIPSADDILHGQNKRQGPVQVKNPPGEVFEYSNMGFTVLQRVVEVATKKSFSDAVRDMVLDPLGMKDSTYTPALEKTIHGSDEEGEPLLCSWVLTPHLAAGGLWTNATEFAQVILAIQGALSNTPLPGKMAPLISEDLVEQMMMGTPQSEKETKVEGRGYGLGIGVDGRAESRYFVHDGVLPGTRTCLRGNGDKGVVVLTNSSNGEHLYREIVKSVAEAYLWPGRDALEILEPKVKQEEYFSPPLTQISSAQAQMKVEGWGARAAGTWVTTEEDGVKHTLDVYGEGNKLFIDIDGGKTQEEGKTYELLPLGEKVACFRPHSPGPYEVCRLEEGEISINVGGVTYTRVL